MILSLVSRKSRSKSASIQKMAPFRNFQVQRDSPSATKNERNKRWVEIILELRQNSRVMANNLMLVFAKINSTYEKNIVTEAVKKSRLFIRFTSVYPADWMLVFLYFLFIARGVEYNTFRKKRHRVLQDDIRY